MQKKLFLSLSLIILSQFLIAQKEANIWYFGNGAGMDFNGGAPVPLTNSAMFQLEGCTSIADANGSLLFYSDGSTVWNKLHVPMPNGTGLLGNNNSAQAALIVSMPGNATQYYIFTTPTSGSGPMNYSIVDMTLAGGNGDVTTKNAVLFSNSTEKLTAVKQSNGTDIWVIGHEYLSNAFYVYPVTSAGVGAPVVSNAGSVHNSVLGFAGCMKASPDGKYVAYAITINQNICEVLDFDNTTGIISNALTFTNIDQAYGIEFSPDGSKLYVTEENPQICYQYDLNAGSPAAITASQTNIATSVTGNFGFAALQLAPDGKIYLAKRAGSPYIDVINNPNALGLACNFVDNAFFLNGPTSQYGLPNFVQSYFSGFGIEDICFGDSTHFTITNSNGLAGVQWDFNDTASGINNFASVFNPVHLFTAPGTYNVQLIEYNLNGTSDTIYTSVTIYAYPQINLGNDTTLCTGNSLLLNVASGYTSYLWQDASTDSIYAVTSAGSYFVSVNNNGCVATDSILIQYSNCATPTISFAASDTNFCEKTCLDFFDLSTNNPTSWQWFFSGASPDTSTAQNPTGICYNSYGNFAVKLIACNTAGCDSLTINQFINEFQNPVDSIWITNDTLWSLPFPSYQWFEVSAGLVAGATNQYFIASIPGSYYCVVNDSIGCIATSNSIAATGLTPGPSQGGEWSIVIAPNPVIDYMNIEIQFNKNENPVFEIFDLQGRIIQTEKILHSHSVINAQSLSSGVYFMKIISTKKSLTEKFTVLK